MTILSPGMASHALRRGRRGRRSGDRLPAVPPPLARRASGPAHRSEAAVLDLALCLILAAVVVGLLLLAL